MHFSSKLGHSHNYLIMVVKLLKVCRIKKNECPSLLLKCIFYYKHIKENIIKLHLTMFVSETLYIAITTVLSK